MLTIALSEKIYHYIQKSNKIENKKRTFYILDAIVQGGIFLVILLIVLYFLNAISKWNIYVAIGASIIAGISSTILHGKILLK